MNWWLMALKKYAVFGGRARRKEYWYFVLFTVIFAIAATILDHALGINFKGQLIGPIDLVFRLAMFLPSLAVLVRRLHDIGKSGWWFFISLIPIIGTIWIIVLLCIDSVPGDNQYGPNPKD